MCAHDPGAHSYRPQSRVVYSAYEWATLAHAVATAPEWSPWGIPTPLHVFLQEFARLLWLGDNGNVRVIIKSHAAIAQSNSLPHFLRKGSHPASNPRTLVAYANTPFFVTPHLYHTIVRLSQHIYQTR